MNERQNALTLLEATRADFLARARSVADQLSLTKKRLTIDDIRDICPPPDNIDPRVMGAVFNTGDWTSVGYKRSRRKTCHQRPIAVFERAR